MKKSYSLLQLARISFIFLVGTAISLPSLATVTAANPAAEYTVCHNYISDAIISTESATELTKAVALFGRGAERRRFSKTGKAGIEKRFGVIGRQSKYDRKRLGCPF